MSQPVQTEQLQALEEITIRGKLSIEDLVRRHIDRCNLSMGGLDPSIFEANVRALLSMLPSNKRIEVLNEESRFNKETSGYQYTYSCGVKCGTPENPITSDGLPPNETGSNVISPIYVEGEETDYEKLYEIILEAFESVGLTWNIEPKFVEHGAVVDTDVVPSITQEATDAVVQVLLKSRDTYPLYNFSMIVESMRRVEPPTPVFKETS